MGFIYNRYIHHKICSVIYTVICNYCNFRCCFSNIEWTVNHWCIVIGWFMIKCIDIIFSSIQTGNGENIIIIQTITTDRFNMNIRIDKNTPNNIQSNINTINCQINSQITTSITNNKWNNSLINNTHINNNINSIINTINSHNINIRWSLNHIKGIIIHWCIVIGWFMIKCIDIIFSSIQTGNGENIIIIQTITTDRFNMNIRIDKNTPNNIQSNINTINCQINSQITTSITNNKWNNSLINNTHINNNINSIINTINSHNINIRWSLNHIKGIIIHWCIVISGFIIIYCNVIFSTCKTIDSERVTIY